MDLHEQTLAAQAARTEDYDRLMQLNRDREREILDAQAEQRPWVG
jgi:hypothetical protein